MREATCAQELADENLLLFFNGCLVSLPSLDLKERNMSVKSV
jgi:hypothetical protein